MRKNSTQEKNALRQSLWLIAHLRAVGAEPLPFEHENYRSYLSDLQRQYDPIRAVMDSEAGREARIAGRALVRQYTLEGVAAQAFPASAHFGISAGRRTAVHHEHEIDVRPTGEPVLPDTAVDPPVSATSKRDLFNCRRKLRHSDYLSALTHLVRLGDPGLHAYPCDLCDGIHVGHDRGRVRLQEIGAQLESVATRMKGMNMERRQLEQHHTSLLLQQRQWLDKALNEEFWEGS